MSTRSNYKKTGSIGICALCNMILLYYESTEIWLAWIMTILDYDYSGLWLPGLWLPSNPELLSAYGQLALKEIINS